MFVSGTLTIPANSGGNTGVARRIDNLSAATTSLTDDTNSHYGQVLSGTSRAYEVNIFGA